MYHYCVFMFSVRPQKGIASVRDEMCNSARPLERYQILHEIARWQP